MPDVYRWPNEDEEADQNSDDEDENERETTQSRRFNRLGMYGPAPFQLFKHSRMRLVSGIHDSDVDWLEISSTASSTPESTPSGSPTSTAALTLSGDDDDELSAISLDDTPAGYADADFRFECTQSLDRALEEGHTVENAAIELKTLRMATNVPITAVKEVVITFLVSKIPLSPDAVTQRKAVNEMIARWGGLLGAIGSESPVESIILLQVSSSHASS